MVEADVWTTDRDFAGAGIASWSMPNLMHALVEGARDRWSTPGSE
jgi:PIN domain